MRLMTSTKVAAVRSYQAWSLINDKRLEVGVGATFASSKIGYNQYTHVQHRMSPPKANHCGWLHAANGKRQRTKLHQKVHHLRLRST